MVFFEDMEIPEEDRIGEEGEGFRTLLHGLNPERVLVAAEAIGIGRAALSRASRYAREREVFALLLEGLPNKLIAQRLEITEKTVKKHVGAIYAKLEVTCRVEAVLLALDVAPLAPYDRCDIHL